MTTQQTFDRKARVLTQKEIDTRISYRGNKLIVIQSFEETPITIQDLIATGIKFNKDNVVFVEELLKSTPENKFTDRIKLKQNVGKNKHIIHFELDESPNLKFIEHQLFREESLETFVKSIRVQLIKDCGEIKGLVLSMRAERLITQLLNELENKTCFDQQEQFLSNKQSTMKVNKPNQCLEKLQQDQQREQQQEQLAPELQAEVDAVQRYLRDNQAILTQKLVFRQQISNDKLYVFFELPKSPKLKLIKLDVEQLATNQVVFLKLIKSQLLKDFGHSFHNMFYYDIVDRLNEYIKELKEKSCVICLNRLNFPAGLRQCQNGCMFFYCQECYSQIKQNQRCFYCRN